ncbi:MAG: M48 family metalloprotease [Actinobacteria bacterium]|nr:M48 family metalloprotease [Actinomycetota bacterium]MTH93038.1 M48 family metalloprotease [Actinomycetota bacterium]
MRQQRKSVESSAFSAVIPVIALLPAWFVSTSIFWWCFSLIFSVNFFIFHSVVALGAGLMFFLPAQRLFVVRLLGTRLPNSEELKRLNPLIKTVAQSARLHTPRFVVAIDESNDINAFACGGHILVVSSSAVQLLSDDELAGVVAHEMSHHLGAHTVALSIGQWLSLPVIACARLGFVLQGASLRIEKYLVQRHRYFRIPSKVITSLFTATAWIFQASLLSAHILNNIVGKNAEFQADARAVTLGFGKQLSAALSRFTFNHENSQREHRSHHLAKKEWHEKIFSSHPEARTRIARIEAQLRTQQQRR